MEFPAFLCANCIKVRGSQSALAEIYELLDAGSGNYYLPFLSKGTPTFADPGLIIFQHLHPQLLDKTFYHKCADFKDLIDSLSNGVCKRYVSHLPQFSSILIAEPKQNRIGIYNARFWFLK